LGRWLAGPWSGAAASLLVLGSPAFLVMLTSAMSDVPVTAWWTLALYTALPTRHPASGRRGLVIIGPAVVSGIASTLAILTRPNTAPLAGVVLALLVLEPAARLRRAGIWLVLVAMSVATIALLNWEWHGSPTQSAYGSVRDIYALDRVWSNARTYARWLLESQTPLVLVALVAPWVLCRTGLPRTVVWILTIVFPLTAVAIYLPYVVFPEWSTLRFLLPAYPPVMAGLAAALIAMVRRHRVGLLATPSMAALVMAFVYHGLRFAGGPIEFAAADARYARALEYVRRVPEPAAFVSLSHSGTIAFYSGRDIVRWEALPPEALDAAVEYLGATGRRVYLVIDDDEREPFLRRFAASRRAQAIADGESVGLGGVSVFALDGGRGLPPW
jgi:4-amino-4-deoxy-L-arabinose transferase-like glycosyltransferase